MWAQVAENREHFKILANIRGVATGWTGVDMCTAVFAKAVPEIDGDPVIFLVDWGVWVDFML